MKKLLVLLFLMALGTGVYAQNDSNGYIESSPKNSSASWFESTDGIFYGMYQSPSMNEPRFNMLIKYPQSKTSATYTIPDGVKKIARGAFKGNKYIQKIRIPSSVYYIGDNAFDDCENLSSIEVYESSSTNVNDVFDDTDSDATEVGRYNIQGVKIQEGEDGQVQIILYSDGTSKKVVTK